MREGHSYSVQVCSYHPLINLYHPKRSTCFLHKYDRAYRRAEEGRKAERLSVGYVGALPVMTVCATHINVDDAGQVLRLGIERLKQLVFLIKPRETSHDATNLSIQEHGAYKPVTGIKLEKGVSSQMHGGFRRTSDAMNIIAAVFPRRDVYTACLLSYARWRPQRREVSSITTVPSVLGKHLQNRTEKRHKVELSTPSPLKRPGKRIYE